MKKKHASYIPTVLMIFLTLPLFVSDVVLMAGEAEDASSFVKHIRQGKESRNEKVSEIRSWLADHPDSSDRILLDHLLAELHRGQYCNESMDIDAWKAQLKYVAKTYDLIKRQNIYLLEMYVTYAQTIFHSQPEESERIFKLIVETPVDNVEVPSSYIWSSLGKRVAVNRVKQGAIWAWLNGKLGTAATSTDRQKKKEVCDQAYQSLHKWMSTTEEGKRCLPLAKWWYDVATDSPHEKTPKMMTYDRGSMYSEESAAEISKRKRQRRLAKNPPVVQTPLPASRKTKRSSLVIREAAPENIAKQPKATPEKLPVDAGSAPDPLYLIAAASLVLVGLVLLITGNTRRRAMKPDKVKTT